MKKKIYLQPVIEVTGITPLQLMVDSRGWSKDGEPPTAVEKEEAVSENDKTGLWDDDSYGGFLDLD